MTRNDDKFYPHYYRTVTEFSEDAEKKRFFNTRESEREKNKKIAENEELEFFFAGGRSLDIRTAGVS